MTKILSTHFFMENQFPHALPFDVRKTLGIVHCDKFNYILQDDGKITVEKA